MLLGTTVPRDTDPTTETLIIQLILQQRYAEAYDLLHRQPSAQTAALYNAAVCLHWSGNYQEALNRLEKIQFSPPMNTSNQPTADENYQRIRKQQNQTEDYLQGMSELYVKSFPVLTYDAIIRLKTDCWLQLGNYAKVIAIAKPIAHKGYQNITNALALAGNNDDTAI
jgi:tetratricopeptide (TPR) repeat protein